MKTFRTKILVLLLLMLVLAEAPLAWAFEYSDEAEAYVYVKKVDPMEEKEEIFDHLFDDPFYYADCYKGEALTITYAFSTYGYTYGGKSVSHLNSGVKNSYLKVNCKNLNMKTFYASGLEYAYFSPIAAGNINGAVFLLQGVSPSLGDRFVVRGMLQYSYNSQKDKERAMKEKEFVPVKDCKSDVVNVQNILKVNYEDYIDISAWKDISFTETELVPDNDVTEYNVIHNISKVIIPQTVDRPARTGDHVVVSCKAKYDGNIYPYASRESQRCVIGGGDLPAELEQRVIGMEVYDSLHFEVDYSEDYHDPMLAGKKIEYRLNVLDVAGVDNATNSEVYNKTGFHSLDELYEHEKQKFLLEYARAIIWTKYMEKTDVKQMNHELEQEYISLMTAVMKQGALLAGVSYADWIQSQYGVSEEIYTKQIASQAEEYAVRKLMIIAYVKDNRLSWEASELKKKMQTLNERHEEYLLSVYTEDLAVFSILYEKMMRDFDTKGK